LACRFEASAGHFRALQELRAREYRLALGYGSFEKIEDRIPLETLVFLRKGAPHDVALKDLDAIAAYHQACLEAKKARGG